MEDAAGVPAAATRGASLLMPSSQAPTLRKEWRVVSEHSVRNAGNDVEFDRSKLGQSDERTIYEVQQRRESCDVVNFCSIQMDRIGGLDDDFEQKLQDLAKRREELQEMEIQLKAHMIARSGIVEMQDSFDTQMEEQANIAAKLQEQLDEREQRIMELERKMEDKERELRAVRLDNEAAWAKEDLLREQNKELANFRRERDNVEAERAHHMKQIHDLQEHIQDKERQVMELQEQHRVAQETILYKDEQLREAQAWIARVQEMDALQYNTNHSLQAELRERNEQYNQLWLGCQRQFVELERLHMQTIRQLQLELAGAKEKGGSYNDESYVSTAKSNDMPQFGQKNGSHLQANGSGSSNGNFVSASNANSENSQTFTSSGNASVQAIHVPGVPITPPLLLGMASYLSSGEVTVHPYFMHQQGANHSVPTSVPQSHVGHFPSMSAVASYQHWLIQQALSNGLQGSSSPSEAEKNLARSDYEISANGQDLPDFLNLHLSKGMEANSVISSTEGVQVLDLFDKGYFTSQGEATLQKISSQFHDAVKLAPLGQTAEIKENDVIGLTNDRSESRAVASEPSGSGGSPLPSEKLTNTVSFTEAIINNTADCVLPEAFVSVRQKNSLSTGTSGIAFLDERSLLACIVRTIPAGGKIRISSTLPNRLGKMLAPLHWHDYKKKYGKLDDFVASHPELFLIEGDYIQLREGAQGIIAATAAVAKVAAAAAATSPFSSLFPPVAVTPMAQANRLKKIPSIESMPISNGGDAPSQVSSIERQSSSGSGLNVAVGLSNVKVLSKSEVSLSISGPDCQPGQSSALNHGEIRSGSDRSGLGNAQGKGQLNVRLAANFISKQQGRAVATQMICRR